MSNILYRIMQFVCLGKTWRRCITWQHCALEHALSRLF